MIQKSINCNSVQLFKQLLKPIQKFRNERNISCANNLPSFSQRADIQFEIVNTHVNSSALFVRQMQSRNDLHGGSIRRGRPSATRKKKRILSREAEKKEKRKTREPRCIGFYSAIRAHTASSLEIIRWACVCGFAIEEWSRGRWILRVDQTLVATISHSFLQPALFRQSFFVFSFSLFFFLNRSHSQLLDFKKYRNYRELVAFGRTLECLLGAFQTR